MPYDWVAFVGEPVAAVEHAVATAAGVEAFTVGPRDWDRIDYPAAQVFHESTTHQGGNDWQHQIRANLLWADARDLDYQDDVLHVVGDVITTALQELAEIDCVYSYVPTSVEGIAGQPEDSATLLLVVSIQFQVGSLQDLKGLG